MTRTRVSVLIPTYNGATYIRDCIESVLAQAMPDAEIILCDDASTDDSTAIAKAAGRGRVSILTNDARLGLVGNWNRCLDAGEADFVCLFHQDDVMAPGFLRASVKALEDHRQAAFAFTSCERIDPDGCVIAGHWTDALPAGDTAFAGADLLALLLSSGNVIPCQSVVMRKEAVRRTGGFDPRLTYTPDYEMWLRLCLEGDAVFLADPLVRIRIHPRQTSSRYSAQWSEVAEMQRALGIFFESQGSRLPDLAVNRGQARAHMKQWTLEMARGAIRNGDLRLAARCARVGLGVGPAFPTSASVRD